MFGLNRMDIWCVSRVASYPFRQRRPMLTCTFLNRQREGKYPVPPGTTEILGVEFSGTVAELGPNVHDFLVGDEVFGLTYGVSIRLLSQFAAIVTHCWVGSIRGVCAHQHRDAAPEAPEAPMGAGGGHPRGVDNSISSVGYDCERQRRRQRSHPCRGLRRGHSCDSVSKSLQSVGTSVLCRFSRRITHPCLSRQGTTSLLQPDPKRSSTFSSQCRSHLRML